MLLAETSTFFWSELGAFASCEGPEGLGAIVGSPSQEIVLQVAQQAEEILTFGETPQDVAQFIPDWHVEQALIYALEKPTPSVPPKHPTRWIDPNEFKTLSYLPASLQEELADAVARQVPIAAALDGERAVSFAYPASTTETWWDMSIDTLASHRRQGFAYDVAKFLLHQMTQTGRKAVWGAVISNLASQSLAKKLGYLEVDSLWLFTSPHAID